MLIQTHYNRIERVTYEFNEADIRAALIAYAPVKYKTGQRIELDINEGDEDSEHKPSASITVIWEEPLPVTPAE